MWYIVIMQQEGDTKYIRERLSCKQTGYSKRKLANIFKCFKMFLNRRQDRKIRYHIVAISDVMKEE